MGGDCIRHCGGAENVSGGNNIREDCRRYQGGNGNLRYCRGQQRRGKLWEMLQWEKAM